MPGGNLGHFKSPIMNKLFFQIMLVFAIIAYIGRMHKDNQKAIRIAEVEAENRVLKDVLRKANTDIIEANKILNSKSILRGEDSVVLYY